MNTHAPNKARFRNIIHRGTTTSPSTNNSRSTVVMCTGSVLRGVDSRIVMVPLGRCSFLVDVFVNGLDF